MDREELEPLSFIIPSYVLKSGPSRGGTVYITTGTEKLRT